MDRFTDHKPPLSTELSDVYWGTHDSYTDRDLEDLHERPSHALPSSRGATARGASDVADAHGADRNVTPSLTWRPGGFHDGSPGPHPDLQEDQ